MKITLNKLRELNACYTDERMLEISGGKRSMELIDIMELDVPAQDRVWVACYCLPEKMRMEFSYTVATRALSRIKKPDPRSVDALKVLRRYIDGEAMKEELNTAACAAYMAADEAYEADEAFSATRDRRQGIDSQGNWRRSKWHTANMVALVADADFATRAVALLADQAAAVMADSVVRMVERHQQIKDIERLLESEGKNNE